MDEFWQRKILDFTLHNIEEEWVGLSVFYFLNYNIGNIIEMPEQPNNGTYRVHESLITMVHELSIFNFSRRD